MASISKVSGKSYRICTDAENDAYDELSFKTDAGDVSFTDGTDVETNLSAIKGITSDMSCEDENIAISAKAVNDSLQNENNESFNFGYLNGVRGFFTNPSRADDSFIPFSSLAKKELVVFSGNGSTQSFLFNENAIPTQGNIIGEYIKVVYSDSASAWYFTALQQCTIQITTIMSNQPCAIETKQFNANETIKTIAHPAYGAVIMNVL